ncbi:MAG: hypothetical protein NUV76_12260 [Candidatus Kuenenia sp.]|nr:hypothetical protein [Candidatus Kuenenia sp.]
MNDSITIAPAVNGGFVITCREERETKKEELMSNRVQEIPYVAKDINSAMKIIKSKLEKYSEEVEEDMEEHKGTMKNAY